jgi:radical SAM superfamily enzyme YgiQ (UPF0313 family)
MGLVVFTVTHFTGEVLSMSYERVLLVNPPSKGEWRGIRPHIGLGYLAQTLADRDIEYDVLDMNLGYRLKHLLGKIDNFKPQILGMTLLTLEYRKFYWILSEIKNFFPHLKIVVGGPHVTITKEKVLKECKAIDFGITYEGEQTLIELCEGRPSEKIKGLLFRADGEVAYSGDRDFETNLDKLPWPKYERFELKRYIPEADIYSSRGCPHQCIFCPNRLISPVFRVRSPENVVDEMEYWYERGYRQFNFDDDNFNLIKERVLKICDEVEKRGMKNLFLRCSNGIRADRMDREILTRMKEVGFRYIAFGVDAGNNRMLQIVKKGETMEQIEQAVKDAVELGYDVKLLFVVGTPYETRADVEDKVRLSLKYPIQDVHFYNIIPYPGTELFEWIKKNNYFLIHPEKYLNDISCLNYVPVFDTPELPADERKKVFRYLKKVQRKVHKQAVRRMMGNGLIGAVAASVVATSLFERLFYGNFLVRKILEHLRYRKAIAT